MNNKLNVFESAKKKGCCRALILIEGKKVSVWLFMKRTHLKSLIKSNH